MIHGRVFSTLALFIPFVMSTPIQAAITTTGNVTPVYNGTDPWVISGQLRIGDTGVGSVSISAGSGVQNTFGFIGRLPGSEGRATVTGNGSSWTNSEELNVGNAGTGELSVLSGGRVENTGGAIAFAPNSTGLATVHGPGSIWVNSGTLEVGRQGDGELTIQSGGRVENVASLIGRFTGSTGTVTVSGAGSTLATNATLQLGLEGEGTLIIDAGGKVETNFSDIGEITGAIGSATVSGAGSTWTNNGSLTVGRRGQGELTIDNGGSVTNTAGGISTQPGGFGTVTVGGAGSNWSNSFSLAIGGSGNNTGGSGTLNINSGGTVYVRHSTVLFPGSQIRLDGGTLDTGAIDVRGIGDFNWIAGKLHVDTFIGSLTNQGGILAPGRPTGNSTITTIVGNYNQGAGAALEIEIGGLLVGSEYDFVNVNFEARLGGELRLLLSDGFVPDADDTIAVLNAAAGISGSFDNVANGERLDTTDGRGSFRVHYGPQSVFNAHQIVLTSFEFTDLPGDYNQSGVVDTADYVLWRKNLGSGMSLPNDDTPGVGSDDYTRWRAQFGQTADGGTTQSSDARNLQGVPEPAGVTMLLVACVALFFRYGRPRFPAW